jgi:carboxyvinyl-carboxyphosphonate phosphorylmutase
MSPTEKRKRFRAILAGAGCVHPASVHDPISARIAEDLGFEAGMFAGSIASLAVLGAPDAVVLTLTELADQALRICRAGALPLLVDADHGYGNALNVMRTVQELETAGVAALTIEDTELPRPYGAGALRLIPVEEGAGKIRAALAARADPSLVIVARTGALAITGMDDAVARARTYAALGADALFLTGVRDLAQLDRVASEVELPLILGGAPGDLGDRDSLAARRVRISLQGHQPFLAAVQAVHATLRALRDGVPPSRLPGLAPAELMKRVTRGAEHDAWTRDFLGG